MTDTKCEPPKPWANEWHWVEKDGKKACAYWWQTMENYWEWFGICPDGAGYRYLAPAAAPDTVRALVEALENIADHPESGTVLTDYDATGKQRVWPTVEEIARAALARAKAEGLA